MSNTYSHRNGETEPPTVEGWYWFYGKHIMHTDAWPNLAKMLHLHLHTGEYPPECTGKYSTMYRKPDRVRETLLPVQLLSGRWWGPVIPPWKEDVHE